MLYSTAFQPPPVPASALDIFTTVRNPLPGVARVPCHVPLMSGAGVCAWLAEVLRAPDIIENVSANTPAKSNAGFLLEFRIFAKCLDMLFTILLFRSAPEIPHTHCRDCRFGRSLHAASAMDVIVFAFESNVVFVVMVRNHTGVSLNDDPGAFIRIEAVTS
jgi:hypothetical protein